MKQLIERLQREGCSVVIRHQGEEKCFWQRGIADLLHLYHEEPSFLHESQLADKVVGKGAASLMVLGRVKDVYAGVISQSALFLLQKAGISVTYGQCVDHIINRTGTDWCPVEKLCNDVCTAEEALPLIEEFVGRMKTIAAIHN